MTDTAYHGIIEDMKKSQNEELKRKLLLTFDLFSAGSEMMWKNLKRKYPQMTDAEITKLHNQWLSAPSGTDWEDFKGHLDSTQALSIDHE